MNLSMNEKLIQTDTEQTFGCQGGRGGVWERMGSLK